MSPTLSVLPRCPEPDCNRLTVDNAQHCPEKTPERWAVTCQWLVCSGTVTTPGGKKVKCGRVYGPKGWPGYSSRAAVAS